MKVTSVRGQVLDVGKFLAENADQIAIGNAKMNARGDIVGPGGRVVKKREDISKEYHRSNPKAAKKVALKDLAAEVYQTPQEAMQALKEEGARQQAVRAAQEAAEEAAAQLEAAAAAPRAKRKISDTDE